MNKEQRLNYHIMNSPAVPSNINRRQVRIELEDGKFVVLKRQIHNSKQLQNILINLCPKNVYISCAQWLNPVNVRHKNSRRGYKIADMLLLDCDVFVDIDKDSPADILKTIKFFKQHEDEYTLQSIIKSGGGYHVIYKEINLSKELGLIHPEERIKFVENKREKLEISLIKFGIDLDKGILRDCMRIRRCPGTLNGNKNYAECKEINITILESLTAMTTKGSPLTNVQTETRPRISVPFFNSYKFISNIVEGISNQYVFYAEIDKTRNYKPLIKKIQTMYYPGTVYVFELPHCYGLLALKIGSARRVEKMLRFCKALNLNQFLRYKHSWIKTSSILRSPDRNNLDGSHALSVLHSSGDVTIHEVKLIDIWPAHTKGVFSNPHAHFIKQYINENTFNEIQDFRNTAGNERNKIYVCTSSEAHS